MRARLERDGYLHQETAVELVGERFTRATEGGGRSIRPRVLRIFHELAGDLVTNAARSIGDRARVAIRQPAGGAEPCAARLSPGDAECFHIRYHRGDLSAFAEPPRNAETPAVAGASSSAGGGTRTPDTRIMIPLL